MLPRAPVVALFSQTFSSLFSVSLQVLLYVSANLRPLLYHYEQDVFNPTIPNFPQPLPHSPFGHPTSGPWTSSFLIAIEIGCGLSLDSTLLSTSPLSSPSCINVGAHAWLLAVGLLVAINSEREHAGVARVTPIQQVFSRSLKPKSNHPIAPQGLSR